VLCACAENASQHGVPDARCRSPERRPEASQWTADRLRVHQRAQTQLRQPLAIATSSDRMMAITAYFTCDVECHRPAGSPLRLEYSASSDGVRRRPTRGPGGSPPPAVAVPCCGRIGLPNRAWCDRHSRDTHEELGLRDIKVAGGKLPHMERLETSSDFDATNHSTAACETTSPGPLWRAETGHTW